MLFTSACYNPTRWDYYWHLPGCEFVMKQLDAPADKIFGTPRLVGRMVERRQDASARLCRASYQLPVDVPDRIEPRNSSVRPRSSHPSDSCAEPLLYGIGRCVHYAGADLGIPARLLAGNCTRIYALAWPVRATPSGAFAIGTTGSAIVYVLSFFPFGVAAEYRYGYWCVLACIAGAAAVMTARRDSHHRLASRPDFPATA